MVCYFLIPNLFIIILDCILEDKKCIHTPEQKMIVTSIHIKT